MSRSSGVAEPSRYGGNAAAETGRTAHAVDPARDFGAANDNQPPLVRRFLPLAAVIALLAVAALALLR
jgi:hypothetical protein